MSTAEIRHDAFDAAADRADMLLRAAISAFAALPRPTRAEIRRLDDLVMPLIDRVTPESRRLAAEMLADNPAAPPQLVRVLASDEPAIAEPILSASPVLRELDLIVVIARGGRPHARIIARRKDLPPTIRDLLAMLHDPQIEALGIVAQRPEPAADAFAALRDAALDEDPQAFARQLAQLLKMSEEGAAELCGESQGQALATALHGLALAAEQAFLILAAAAPGRFANRAAIRNFLAMYECLGDR